MTRCLLLGLLFLSNDILVMSYAKEPAAKSSAAGNTEPKSETARENAAVTEAFHKLRGKWNVTSVLKNGAEIPELVKLDITFTFSDSSLKIGGIDSEPIPKVVQLNPETSPKLLDLADSAADMRDRKNVWEGVYELDGDSLKWALMLEGDAPAKANRAAAVESKVGSNVLLVTMQRAKE